jgi:hypothetical protein
VIQILYTTMIIDTIMKLKHRCLQGQSQGELAGAMTPLCFKFFY